MRIKKAIPERRLELYDQLIAGHSDIKRKGKKLPYTSHNGHMFTVFSDSGQLGFRLSKEDRIAFLEKYQTTLLHSYGAVMKEYVVIPDELLEDQLAMTELLKKSYHYISSLKLKTTK